MSDHRQWVELDPSNGTEAAKPPPQGYREDTPSAAAPAQTSAQPAESPVPDGPDGSPDR
ncbi:hypothetical protein [Azospirillum isscasi]|uniref:Uncharacterized protein n=1 Tax=Azospirillum isscasi TaxID=3053926 RepID=A0ABU0WN78_9PROT|nr:hypothetical protein [Azospirillum isscasi]MDQ2105696.1 hypothetical protein [Azospirillum isscasi]